MSMGFDDTGLGAAMESSFHDNRIKALEKQKPMSRDEFIQMQIGAMEARIEALDGGLRTLPRALDHDQAIFWSNMQEVRCHYTAELHYWQSLSKAGDGE